MSTNEPDEDSHILSDSSDSAAVSQAPAGINKVTVALLFVAAVVYSAAVGGAMEVLGAFVLKQPLSWTATQVIPHRVYFDVQHCAYCVSPAKLDFVSV